MLEFPVESGKNQSKQYWRGASFHCCLVRLSSCPTSCKCEDTTEKDEQLSGNNGDPRSGSVAWKRGSRHAHISQLTGFDELQRWLLHRAACNVIGHARANTAAGWACALSVCKLGWQVHQFHTHSTRTLNQLLHTIRGSRFLLRHLLMYQNEHML